MGLTYVENKQRLSIILITSDRSDSSYLLALASLSHYWWQIHQKWYDLTDRRSQLRGIRRGRQSFLVSISLCVATPQFCSYFPCSSHRTGFTRGVRDWKFVEVEMLVLLVGIYCSAFLVVSKTNCFNQPIGTKPKNTRIIMYMKTM